MTDDGNGCENWTHAITYRWRHIRVAGPNHTLFRCMLVMVPVAVVPVAAVTVAVIDFAQHLLLLRWHIDRYLLVLREL